MEVGFAIGRSELPVGAQMRTAVLERVTRTPQVLDTVIEGHHAGDFLADLPAVFATEPLGAFAIDCLGQIAQDAPFGTRFTDGTWDFRTERNASLGGRLRSTVVLL